MKCDRYKTKRNKPFLDKAGLFQYYVAMINDEPWKPQDVVIDIRTETGHLKIFDVMRSHTSCKIVADAVLKAQRQPSSHDPKEGKEDD